MAKKSHRTSDDDDSFGESDSDGLVDAGRPRKRPPNRWLFFGGVGVIAICIVIVGVLLLSGKNFKGGTADKARKKRDLPTELFAHIPDQYCFLSYYDLAESRRTNSTLPLLQLDKQFTLPPNAGITLDAVDVICHWHGMVGQNFDQYTTIRFSNGSKAAEVVAACKFEKLPGQTRDIFVDNPKQVKFAFLQTGPSDLLIAGPKALAKQIDLQFFLKLSPGHSKGCSPRH